MSEKQDETYRSKLNRVFQDVKAHFKSLPNPGPLEQLNSDFRSIFPTHLFFDGGRIEIMHHLSQLTQLSHTFHVGSLTNPAGYTMGVAHYLNPPTAENVSFVQGLLDTTAWTLQGRYNRSWNKHWISKLQGQLALQPIFGSRYDNDPMRFLRNPAEAQAQSGIAIEQEYVGLNYTANFKLINPSAVVLPISGQAPVVFPFGVITASWLQNVGKKTALGYEMNIQKPRPEMRDTVVSVPSVFTHSFLGKFRYSPQNSPYPDIFTANVTIHKDDPSQASSLSTCVEYYKKVDEHMDLGAEVKWLAKAKDAVLALHGKLDFKNATLRARVDSTGKVSTILEERLVPNVFTFIVCAEIDHSTRETKSKFGVGVTFEA